MTSDPATRRGRTCADGNHSAVRPGYRQRGRKWIRSTTSPRARRLPDCVHDACSEDHHWVVSTALSHPTHRIRAGSRGAAARKVDTRRTRSSARCRGTTRAAGAGRSTRRAQPGSPALLPLSLCTARSRDLSPQTARRSAGGSEKRPVIPGTVAGIADEVHRFASMPRPSRARRQILRPSRDTRSPGRSVARPSSARRRSSIHPDRAASRAERYHAVLGSS